MACLRDLAPEHWGAQEYARPPVAPLREAQRNGAAVEGLSDMALGLGPSMHLPGEWGPFYATGHIMDENQLAGDGFPGMSCYHGRQD